MIGSGLRPDKGSNAVVFAVLENPFPSAERKKVGGENHAEECRTNSEFVRDLEVYAHTFSFTPTLKLPFHIFRSKLFLRSVVRM